MSDVCVKRSVKDDKFKQRVQDNKQDITDTETSCILSRVIQLTPLSVTNNDWKQSECDACEHKDKSCYSSTVQWIITFSSKLINVYYFTIECKCSSSVSEAWTRN